MASVSVTQEVVVNRCYGGFSLSDAAIAEYARRKGFSLHRKAGDAFNLFKDQKCTQYFHQTEIPRNDPDLIAIVRSMGKRANGEGSNLQIRIVEATIEIESQDGLEKPKVYGR
jgi:hypothetical protein